MHEFLEWWKTHQMDRYVLPEDIAARAYAAGWWAATKHHIEKPNA